MQRICQQKATHNRITLLCSARSAHSVKPSFLEPNLQSDQVFPDVHRPEISLGEESLEFAFGVSPLEQPETERQFGSNENNNQRRLPIDDYLLSSPNCLMVQRIISKCLEQFRTLLSIATRAPQQTAQAKILTEFRNLTALSSVNAQMCLAASKTPR
jgi:hypothetical protein